MNLFANCEATKHQIEQLFNDAACVGIMEAAVLKGAAEIDCPAEAKTLRARFCNFIANCQELGDRRFDDLEIVVDDGHWVLIYPRRPGEPRLRGGMLAVRQGARFCFNEQRIIRQR
jgi:hypothetical protein